MNASIKISVLMAVYDTDFFIIKRAIDSVLNQSLQDFELIIIDDGSQNNTHFQLVNYINRHEDKITYLRHKNRGQSESINRGVLISSGEYITIIDADDEYQPNHLESCLGQMLHSDLISSTPTTIVNNEEDYFVPDKHDNSLLVHVDDCILFATLFGKKEVFESVKFKNMYAADANFYESASEKYNVKKVDLRTYVYYRNMPNSISATIKREKTSI